MRQIARRVIKVALLFLLVSCTSVPYGPYSAGPHPLGEVKEWNMRLFPEPGRIELEAELQHGSDLVILLGAKNRDYIEPVRIVFSDEKCDTGHQIRVTYYVNRTEKLFKYFDTINVWGNDSLVTIEWDNDRRFSVTINGETMRAKTFVKFDSFEIKNEGGVKIKNLQYIKSV